MKKYLLATFAAVVLLGVSSQVARADITSNLQGWWQLDEGSGSAATDSSGSGNDATLVGSPTYGTAKIGAYSLNLNGTSQYIQLPSSIGGSYPTSGSTNTYTLTFSTWFKTTTGGVILSQDNGTLPPNGVGGYVPAVYVSPSDGKIYASLFWHGSTAFQIISPAAYNDGNWHQVVDVFSNGTETLYVDGTSVGSQTGRSESAYSGTYAYFVGTGYGSSWPGLSASWVYFGGSLDDVRVYNRALSSSDVSELYSYTGERIMTGGGFSNPTPPSGSTPVAGWAWSSNIGWISFNSSDDGTGDNGIGESPTPYSVNISTSTNPATFNGYAWSPNLGWISFEPGDISDCGTPVPATAAIDANGNLTGQVTGFVRVISEKGRSDGWDGCVRLGDVSDANQLSPTSDTISTNLFTGSDGGSYLKGGVTYSTGKQTFRGFAWASDVLGWLSFDNPLSNYAVHIPSCPPDCPTGPDFNVSGPGIIIPLNSTDKQIVDTTATIFRVGPDTTTQVITPSLGSVSPSGVTARIPTPTDCTLDSSTVSCTVPIRLTYNGGANGNYTVTMTGTRTDNRTRNVAITMNVDNTTGDTCPPNCPPGGGDGGPVQLYIGPNQATINSKIAVGQTPTSATIKKGDPFALEWKIDLDPDEYICSTSFDKGNWSSDWGGSLSYMKDTVDSKPSIDTSANSAATYTFSISCPSNQGNLPQGASVKLILQSSSESEI